MYLMTWQGTLLAHNSARGLHHVDAAESKDLIYAPIIDGKIRLEETAIDGFTSHQILQGVNLRSGRGKFLCAEPMGIIREDRDYPSTWEKFVPVTLEGSKLYNQHFHNPDSEKKRFVQEVERLTKSGEPAKIYVGAGLVPRAGFLNLDIAMMAPEFAISNLNEYFIFPYADCSWEIPDNSIDYIFHEDFIEHIPQITQWQFLAESLRVLKRECWHRVNTPNLLASMKRHSDFSKGAPGVYDGEKEHEHIAILTPYSLKEIAETIGYREVVFTTRNHGVSPYAEIDFRPGGDRDEVIGNIFADLLK